VLAVAAALALGPIAVALANGGPSAGNNQYSDPLGNTTTATHRSAPPPAATTTPTPAPTTSPPVAATADPTTTATTSTTSTTSAGKSLPMTGYDAWLSGAFGVFLVAGGIAVRRRYASR
jgi:hypothetical protein